MARLPLTGRIRDAELVERDCLDHTLGNRPLGSGEWQYVVGTLHYFNPSYA
jgi:hypothetical protein